MADNTTSENTSALDILAKPSAISKAGITNQSVLEDMQKLYEQKLAEKNYWLQDLADAQAWWSGGAAGPSEGLARRAQTRALQSKQLEDLQAALSQGKVNIAQLNEANASMGQPNANLSGLPTGTAGAPSAATPTGGYTIRGVPVPEGTFRAYQMYIKSGNLAKANEVFDKYTQEAAKGEIGFTTNPSSYKQDEYWDEKTGTMQRRTPVQIRGAAAPSEAPSAQPSTAAPTSAKVSEEGDIYRFENLSDNAKQRLRESAKTQLGLKNDVMDRTDVAELFNKAPMEQRKAAFLAAGEKPVATTAAAAPTSGAPVKTYSDYLTEQAGQKSYAEKSGAESGKAAGTRQGAFEESAVEASKDLQNANVMLNIIDKHPEAVGFGYKNRALGSTIEGIKLLTGKDIEPFARRMSLSQEAIEAGNKFDKFAEENNLKFRKSVMKGTGQVSDFETKLTERASGLSKDNSVEANRFFATIAAENYRTLDKLGVEWQKYQKAHPGAKFAEFEQSDVWKNAQAEREARLKKYFPEIERGDLGFGEKAPSKGASNEELEGWKKRYGKKKED